MFSIVLSCWVNSLGLWLHVFLIGDALPPLLVRALSLPWVLIQEFQVRLYQRLAYGALDFAKTPVQLLFSCIKVILPFRGGFMFVSMLIGPRRMQWVHVLFVEFRLISVHLLTFYQQVGDTTGLLPSTSEWGIHRFTWLQLQEGARLGAVAFFTSTARCFDVLSDPLMAQAVRVLKVPVGPPMVWEQLRWRFWKGQTLRRPDRKGSLFGIGWATLLIS